MKRRGDDAWDLLAPQRRQADIANKISYVRKLILLERASAGEHEPLTTEKTAMIEASMRAPLIQAAEAGGVVVARRGCDGGGARGPMSPFVIGSTSGPVGHLPYRTVTVLVAASTTTTTTTVKPSRSIWSMTTSTVNRTSFHPRLLFCCTLSTSL